MGHQTPLSQNQGPNVPHAVTTHCLYGAETWAVQPAHEHPMDVKEMSWLRAMTNHSLREEIPNSAIRLQAQCPIPLRRRGRERTGSLTSRPLPKMHIFFIGGSAILIEKAQQYLEQQKKRDAQFPLVKVELSEKFDLDVKKFDLDSTLIRSSIQP